MSVPGAHPDAMASPTTSGSEPSAAVRLTKAQAVLLSEVESKGTVYVVDTYKPMLRLVEVGLATYHAGRFNHGHVRITDAGRAALKAESRS